MDTITPYQHVHTTTRNYTILKVKSYSSPPFFVYNLMYIYYFPKHHGKHFSTREQDHNKPLLGMTKSKH